MENVAIKVEGSKLVITVDAAADLGLSASGKTRLVASTKGNKAITVGGRTVFLGLNAYTK